MKSYERGYYAEDTLFEQWKREAHDCFFNVQISVEAELKGSEEWGGGGGAELIQRKPSMVTFASVRMKLLQIHSGRLPSIKEDLFARWNGTLEKVDKRIALLNILQEIIFLWFY